MVYKDCKNAWNKDMIPKHGYDMYKLLKKDGILVYSTCSILKEENEQIINEILKINNLEIIFRGKVDM